MVRLPRKLKKRLKNQKRKQRIADTLKLVSLACGSAAAAMNAYMIAISAYGTVRHLKEFNLPK